MRHRFHSICPYFAMFPEQFVQKHLVWSEPGDIVLDPFVGRGTTVFQALLSDRQAIGGDTNEVAVCVSRAKATAPRLERVLSRIDQLESTYRRRRRSVRERALREFFSVCFHPSTLDQVLYLRAQLAWKRSSTDAFVAALILGVLHGESHRSAWCLSNRMPRTISTKPAYSVRWWRAHGLVPPRRDAFQILREVALYRYVSPVPVRRGVIVQSDARRLGSRLRAFSGRVTLLLTSPPYIDTTDYREDQWLRLWFLGAYDQRPRRERDDRHRGEVTYWRFLTESWAGIRDLLGRRADVIIRIGGRRTSRESARAGLLGSLRDGLDRPVRLLDEWSSSIVDGQVHAFRPGAEGTKVEHDFHLRVY
jgi:hypothetical protein